MFWLFLSHTPYYSTCGILKIMTRKLNFKKIFAGVLYVLPIVFFAVAYFGLVSTGEDILQGAGSLANGNTVDFVGDVSASFNNNGRLTDMYAWGIIDLFDYQFSFGVDTIFRLLDVAMAVGIFYMMTYIVIGRKPKLEIKDAAIFACGFLTLILTQHGRVLYAGFSVIHNYMMGIFIFLLFLMPYIKWLRGGQISKKWWWGLPVLGVVFGMSAALTPLAFLVTATIYIIYIRVKEQKKIPAWYILGIVATAVGFSVSNVLGPGAGNYAGNELYTATYDYIGFSEIFSGGGIVKVFLHLVSNSGRVLVPIIILVALLWMFAVKPLKIEKERLKIITFLVIFAVVLVCGSFQVNAPLRVLLPAYVALVIVAFSLFPQYKKTVIGGTALVGVVVVVITKCVLVGMYAVQSADTFKYIRESETYETCVTPEMVKSYNFPIVYLGQEDMVMEWATPEPIYKRSVTFCK